MQYFSTNHNAPPADFRQATIAGQAPDKGLYFPSEIPSLPEGFCNTLEKRPRQEIALQVIRPYVGDAIPLPVLKSIVADTIDFDFPLIEVAPGISSLELFHGPTLAFKDVGARFMSRCLEYFVRDNNKKVTVLTATSGDTGGAVANGFYEAEGIDVVVLYPSGKVSKVQEMQLTHPGKNIHALEINGSFDDCQRMVKQAFADQELNRELMLTSANSINVARWLPQQFYYFFAMQQWPKNIPPVISVPSGNFGNLCAGLLAYRSGLPVHQFIAACNANDVVPQYFRTGRYQPQPSVTTLSNAMDVGDPSNFVRILQLFGSNPDQLGKIVSSYSVGDEETADSIRHVFRNYNYLMDPHGAVAYAALKKYQQQHPASEGIFLETAHPVKFHDTVETLVAQTISLPPALQALANKQKKSLQMEANYESLREFLLGH